MTLEDQDIWIDLFESMGDRDVQISNKKTILRVVEDADFLGCTYGTYKIEIIKSCVDDKKTLLHEMIHLFESRAKYLNPIINEWLYRFLYRKLSSRISDLDDRILHHAYSNLSSNMENLNGLHGILFYLKSLDLDIRCDYSLGTICGYGRDEYV